MSNVEYYDEEGNRMLSPQERTTAVLADIARRFIERRSALVVVTTMAALAATTATAHAGERPDPSLPETPAATAEPND